MAVLRINQQPGSAPNRYRIDVSAADVPSFRPTRFSQEIEFALSPQDRERIRWYLEDYPAIRRGPGTANRQGHRILHGGMWRKAVQRYLRRLARRHTTVDGDPAAPCLDTG